VGKGKYLFEFWKREGGEINLPLKVY